MTIQIIKTDQVSGKWNVSASIITASIMNYIIYFAYEFFLILVSFLGTLSQVDNLLKWKRTPCFDSVGVRFRQFLLQLHINSSISASN